VNSIGKREGTVSDIGMMEELPRLKPREGMFDKNRKGGKKGEVGGRRPGRILNFSKEGRTHLRKRKSISSSQWPFDLPKPHREENKVERRDHVLGCAKNKEVLEEI